MSGSIKVCQSYLLYYSKQVYWICLYIVMFHTQTKILNCCWFWANTYVWQHRPTIRYFTAICKVTTSKFTAKLLLLFHSENYTKLNFVVVSHKIFLARLFCAPYLLRPGATAPLCPPSVTPLIVWSIGPYKLISDHAAEANPNQASSLLLVLPSTNITSFLSIPHIQLIHSDTAAFKCWVGFNTVMVFRQHWIDPSAATVSRWLGR